MAAGNFTTATNGTSPVERLTPSQIEAMAETLYDFTWNHDPNDPHCFKQRYADAGAPAKRHYREGAVAVLLSWQRGRPVWAWGDEEVQDHPMTQENT